MRKLTRGVAALLLVLGTAQSARAADDLIVPSTLR